MAGITQLASQGPHCWVSIFNGRMEPERLSAMEKKATFASSFLLPLEEDKTV
jgi:hypothetical protein